MRVSYAILTGILSLVFASCKESKNPTIGSENTVVCTSAPGTLADKMSGEDWTKVKKMSIKGPLNEDDFLFLKSLDNNGLTHLDLSDADVKNIGFFFCENNMEEITLPDCIEHIDEEAFQACINLKRINISEKNTHYKVIDDILYTKGIDTIIAFPAKCAKEYYLIPKSVRVLCSCPFLCLTLKSIEVEEGNEYFHSENGVMYSKNKENLLAYPAGKNDNTLTIPSQTNAINWSTFWYATNLKEIQSDPNNSLYDCRDGYLISTDADYKEEIGQPELTEKTFCTYPAGKEGKTCIIPDDINNIDICAFRGTNVERIVLGSKTSGIEKRAFHDSHISEIQSPETNEFVQVKNDIVYYDNNAYVCAPLKKGKVDINANAVLDRCFQRCNEITEANINTSEQIGAFAFSYCKKLKKIIIGEKVPGIETGAFFACTSLEKIELPCNLTKIDGTALCGDFQLKTIICHASTPPTVGTNAFLGIDKKNCTLLVPKNSIVAYKNAPEWNKFENIKSID